MSMVCANECGFGWHMYFKQVRCRIVWILSMTAPKTDSSQSKRPAPGVHSQPANCIAVTMTDLLHFPGSAPGSSSTRPNTPLGARTDVLRHPDERPPIFPAPPASVFVTLCTQTINVLRTQQSLATHDSRGATCPVASNNRTRMYRTSCLTHGMLRLQELQLSRQDIIEQASQVNVVVQ